MKRALHVVNAIFLIVPFLLSSCASYLNGKVQDVKLTTSDRNAEIYVDGEQEGEGRYTDLKLERDKVPKEVRVDVDGYKPEYAALVQSKRPWLYYLSIFPFGVLFYPPFMDYGPKAFDYKDKYSVRNTAEFPDRQKDQKFLFLDDLTFNVNKEDFNFQYYEDYEDFQSGSGADESLELDEDMSFTADDGRNVMNQILNQYNYIDTTENIFRDKTNTVYLEAEIQELDFDINWPFNTRFDESVEKVNVVKGRAEVNMALKSIYGDDLYETNIRARSGTFTTKDGYEDAFGDVTRDVIYSALADFIKRGDVQDHLKKEERTKPEFDMLTLQLGEAIKSLNEAQQATVTIKVGDQGHGSGCVIGRNGYIVTNYHVVAPAKDDLEVRLNNGQKLKAELVRKNAYSDLALIKVDKQFNITYTIPTEKSFKSGMTAYAIGTPESMELGQTLTKGIVSGVREHKANTYIQSDVSVNPGSSGGALVNDKGYIVGVVSSKVMGYSTEGISFSFPAHLVDDRLGIRYETD